MVNAGSRARRATQGYRTLFALGGRMILLAVLVLGGACAKKEIEPVVQISAESALFATAERLFEAKSYDEALASYQSYVAQYPNKPMADAALMKIGRIFSTKGDFHEERIAYQRLFMEYPQSRFAVDAKLAFLNALYKEGDYSAVIIKSKAFLHDTSLSKQQKIKIFTLMGDTYLATGEAAEAAIGYANAYALAGPSDQAAIWTLFGTAIESLKPVDIDRYLDEPPKGAFGGFFLYHLGLGLSEMKKDQEALAVLTGMIKRFPKHALTPDAKSLLEILAERNRPEQVVIGCLLPLTGAYKTYGQRALKGIELAISRFEEKKGGPSVQLIVKDTASDPETAVTAFRQLADAGASAVIGPMITAWPVAEVAEKAGVPLIALSGKDGIPDLGDFIFRNFLTPRMQIEALVPHAVQVMGLKRFAVLYPDEKYGTTMMNLFRDAVTAQACVVTGAEAYEPGTIDFAKPIERLVESSRQVPEAASGAAAGQAVSPDKPQTVAGDPSGGPVPKPQGDETPENGTQQSKGALNFDAIFIPDAADKIGMIAPQLAFHHVGNVVLLGTNLWHSDQLIKAAMQHVQGAVLPEGFFAESELPHVQAFATAFKNTYGEPPGFIEAIAFDTAMMISGLASQPDNVLSRKAFRDAIAKIKDYPGVTGLTSFMENGEAKKQLFLLCIKNDQFVALPATN